MIQLLHGDCLEVMHTIPDGSVDMILADLPYGTTACKWDTIIPLDELWKHYKRIIKRNGAIVLTASQPFTSALVMSNPQMFRYEWLWEKSKPTGFLDAARKPLKAHENILVFYSVQPTYNPQKWEVDARFIDRRKTFTVLDPNSDHYGFMGHRARRDDDGLRLPLSIIPVPSPHLNVHPTQKPVALMEYLIRTYTNEGETVLDNTMGSGTTGVACINTNRHFIGIEKDAGYFQIAQERIERAQSTMRQATMEVGA